MISYVMPTRNRPEVLERTLDRIAVLGEHDAEVIIADNASDVAVRTRPMLPSGVPVRVLRLSENHAAAARNMAAREAHRRSQWIVMLDDDSYPVDLGLLRAVAQAAPETGAIAAEIFLPRGSATRREQGGLPEVFIGCGVAIRTQLFNRLGGYDAEFDYYAEEYDLAARLMLAGWQIELDRRFRVVHEKITRGRDFGRIVRNLVRNNVWVAQRYAPEAERATEIRRHITRYAAIARKEGAIAGYARGLTDVLGTLDGQVRNAMSRAMWDRFTGLSACRAGLREAHAAEPLGRVAVVAAGKNEWAVLQGLDELGVEVVGFDEAQTLVVGTLSPGPMLDGLEELLESDERRVVSPWSIVTDASPVAIQSAA